MENTELIIFLSGSVHKNVLDDRGTDFFWSDDEQLLLEGCMTGVRVAVLNPNKIKIDRSKYLERFQADLEMVLASDLVLVDARTKKGLGVGAELMMAHYEGIPVIGLCPDGSAYRREAWLHPFVGGLVTHRFDGLQGIIGWIVSQVEAGNLLRHRQAYPCRAEQMFALKKYKER